MKKIKSIISLCILLTSVAKANPVVDNAGIGTRSYGMGNNFVALANDFSAVYWNPAGLAFTPVREFNISLMGIANNATADNAGTSTSNTEQRVRLSSAGWLRSIPTSQGGFSFALGFSSPELFDDVIKYQGTDVYLGTDTLKRKNSIVYYDNNDRIAFGQLDYWTAALGWQVAPRLGVGLSASFITGSENRSVILQTRYVNGPYKAQESIENTVTAQYLGYDVRVGVLYHFSDVFAGGLRIEMPQTIWANNTDKLIDHADPTQGIQYPDLTYNSKLTSPTNFAAGAAFTFPFCTIASDVNLRSPIPDRTQYSSLNSWNTGAGIGVEVPIQAISSALRLGYRWQQLELHPMNENIAVDEGTLLVIHNKNLVTAGFLVQFQSVAIEAAYGLSYWDFSVSNADYQNAIIEHHSNHRLLLSFSFRY